ATVLSCSAVRAGTDDAVPALTAEGVCLGLVWSRSGRSGAVLEGDRAGAGSGGATERVAGRRRRHRDARAVDVDAGEAHDGLQHGERALAALDTGCGHHGPVDRHVVPDGRVVAPVDRAEVHRAARVAVRAVPRAVPELDAGRAG